MKKTLRILVITLLLMSLGTASVWAVDPASLPAMNPDKDALKTQLLALKNLEQQSKDLRDQIKDQTAINKDLLTAIKGSTGQDQLEKVKQVHEQNQALRAQLTPLVEQAKTLKQQMQAAPPEEKAALAQQIKQLMDQVQALREQMQANLETVKTDVDALKAQRDARKQALEAVKPIWQAQKDLWAQLKPLQEQKKQLLATMKTQVQAKDFTGAQDTVAQLTSCINQTQTLLTQILDNKKQVTAQLQAIQL